MNADFNGITLRKAAGTYRLLDLRNHGASYKAPLALNETAGEMLSEILSGKTEKEVARAVAEECEVPYDTVLRDITDLMAKVKEYIGA